MHARCPAIQRLGSALGLIVLISACVSPPRAVGPTTLSGPLPRPREGAAATATRAPGATDGPLRILEPRFSWTHATPTEATYEWGCTVENPADEGFRVTIVVHLLDENGRELAAANQAFQIGGKATMPVNGDGLIAGEQSIDVASWRIEYWVQTYPRPIRDR